jgi:hypothetical protein
VLLQGREQGRPANAGVNRIAFSDRLEHLRAEDTDGPPVAASRGFEDLAAVADN